MTIREETPADFNEIFNVNRLAFNGEEESRLVDTLREDGVFIASLVAEEDGAVLGHILFTELPIETSTGTIRGAALAPMAVLPDLQRQGIGSALVRAGLDACRQCGVAVVVVVGHREYYPRFGFSAELARSLRAPFSGESFMALELVPGVLAGATGIVRYAAAFGV